MQVNIQNRQRPTLFQEFFDKLITYSNEVIEYMNTSIKKTVTSDSCKTAKTHLDNIKKSLKSAKNKHSALIIFGKAWKKIHRELRLSEECGVKNIVLRDEMREMQSIRRELQTATT